MMAGAAARVFVVDDDASVRKSLGRVITSAGYAMELFASAQEFLACPPPTGPCCLVLDVRMPGITGLDLQKTLAEAVHRVPVVFVTGHGDISMSVTALKGGAVDRKALLDAIARALAKDTRDLATEARIGDIQERAKLLTPRESQVFALVVTGMLNKQIASELGVGEKTVKAHRARVMEKMRAGSVAELVRLADGVGIIVTAA